MNPYRLWVRIRYAVTKQFNPTGNSPLEVFKSDTELFVIFWHRTMLVGGGGGPKETKCSDMYQLMLVLPEAFPTSSAEVSDTLQQHPTHVLYGAPSLDKVDAPAFAKCVAQTASAWIRGDNTPL